MSTIIAVSDVHLGTENSNSNDFLRFLELCNTADIDDLVLLGDIMDFWRRNNAKIVIDEDNAKILEKIALLDVKNIHYIVGNHDYYMLRLFERYEDSYPFSVSKSLRLENGGRSFYFIHGYELEVLETLQPATIEQYEVFSENMCFAEDMIGGFASSLWSMKSGCEDIIDKTTQFLKKPPNEREDIANIYDLAISKGAYILLGMKPDEYLVYGHTHRPYASEKHKRANTGAWVQDNKLKNKSINTYVKIKDGEVSLQKFNPYSFP